MIKPPANTDSDNAVAATDETTVERELEKMARAAVDPHGFQRAKELEGAALLSRARAADELKSISSQLALETRIAEVTKSTASIREAFETRPTMDLPYIFRDPAHERFLAEQRAADERHKAELRAADRRAGLADAMCDALLARIREFEATLDIDEEIAVALANFGQYMTIRIDYLTYQDPHLLVFDGEGPNGESVCLLQHTSQANVLLQKVKIVGDRPARRVGFSVESAESSR